MPRCERRQGALGNSSPTSGSNQTSIPRRTAADYHAQARLSALARQRAMTVRARSTTRESCAVNSLARKPKHLSAGTLTYSPKAARDNSDKRVRRVRSLAIPRGQARA